MRVTIPSVVKKEVLTRNKCDNKPDNPAVGCKGYECPLWKCNQGLFDESGKEIDHIIEVKHGGTNELTNLQLLCPCCHSVKTKRCAKQKWDFNSIEIENGAGYMEIELPNKKRKIQNL